MNYKKKYTYSNILLQNVPRETFIITVNVYLLYISKWTFINQISNNYINLKDSY